jgi:hypothetical protein
MCIYCEKKPLSDDEKKRAKNLNLKGYKDIRAIKVELIDTDNYSDIDIDPFKLHSLKKRPRMLKQVNVSA